MPGQWEGGFIKGAGNKSSVGVLVERTSRLVLLAHMVDATAAPALAGFTAKLNVISAPLRNSLTYDQGKEMTRLAGLPANTGARVYFMPGITLATGGQQNFLCLGYFSVTNQLHKIASS